MLGFKAWMVLPSWSQLCKRLGGCYTTAHFEEANEEGSVFLHSRIPLFSGPHVPHPKYNVISPTYTPCWILRSDPHYVAQAGLELMSNPTVY